MKGISSPLYSFSFIAVTVALVTGSGCSSGLVSIGNEGADGGPNGVGSNTTSGAGSNTTNGSSTAGGPTSRASLGSSGPGSSSAGSSAGGIVDAGADGGACCPAGWDLYSCAFQDGGAGLACHDPTRGCASSSYCGTGCDAVVTGRCADGGSDSGSSGESDAASPSCPVSAPTIGSPCPEAGMSCSYGGGICCQGGYTCGQNLKWQLVEATCACDSDAGTPNLQWWTSCGPPVCVAPNDAGLVDGNGNPCPPVGSSCSSSGQTCGTASGCNGPEECSVTDPKANGCPISSRKFKDDIRYVDAPELDQLHDEAMHIRLATYQYKPQFGDPDATHLGFIVEDDPRSPAVDHDHDRVDMYGYVSMVVAAMQVQQREIDELRRALDDARTSCAKAAETPASVDPRLP